MTEIISGWKFIEFPNLGVRIPSNRTILELIYRQYPTTDFKSIRDDVAIEDNKALYALLSLRAYGLEQKTIDPRSLGVAKDFSNQLLVMIKSELENHSDFDETCMIFCANKGIDYMQIRYFGAIVSYCLRILPRPLNYVPNIDKDSKLAIFINNSFPQVQKIGEFPKHPDCQLAAYQARKWEAERRASIMFTDYRIAKDCLSIFSEYLAAEHSEIFDYRFQANYSTVTSNRNHRRGKKTKEKDLFLCRCEFCYRFRTIERKRGGDPAWHCHRKQCKDQYRAWVNDLNIKDINLETLLL